ncbi:hypothetical protein H7J51_22320 [Mycobacterium crocinum]|uniref:PPE family protein n=1 Tax=Mycolicibacterium crocinum TaxID=388459 RepID=A0ABY3TLD0_9MYCO|nr:hypothetical protein [Mycolicibacterium crocinum]MCV7218010.1 hypothetical protein [Mycolicibacterium crocinum]ULN40534.1 hypothetical protein MI149_23195 [Mycolicibacterium crocinum]
MNLSTRSVIALTTGVFASAGVGLAPTANATCASVFGIGNSANCSSTQTSVAIAIGPSATAHAFGNFDSAFAVGNAAGAWTYGVADSTFALGDNTIADAGGYTTSAFGVSTAVGKGSTSQTYGFFSLAFSAHGKTSAGGSNSFGNAAIALGRTGVASAGTTGTGDLAIDAFGHGDVMAIGAGNVAVNLGGSTVFVEARGNFNNATNILGGGNSVLVGNAKPATGSWAFAVLGTGNAVQAEPGPVAVAGSILHHGVMITKQGPGFNINGVVAGGAAAVPAAHATPAAKTPRHAGSGRHLHA